MDNIITANVYKYDGTQWIIQWVIQDASIKYKIGDKITNRDPDGNITSQYEVVAIQGSKIVMKVLRTLLDEDESDDFNVTLEER